MQIVDEKKIDDEIFKTLPIRQIAKQKKIQKRKDLGIEIWAQAFKENKKEKSPGTEV